ncbi:MAG: hypothetical protein IJR26_02480 [Bacteroidales bacterium]|nr:hypothetical protein [Bacteroidales bacterium]
MNKTRIATIVLAALALLNYLVGGLLGFICIGSENMKIFTFLFCIFLLVSVVCLLTDWMTLRQAESGMEYKVLKLRRGRFVREPRKMRRDDEGLQALQMGISGWSFSLIVPLFAFGLIWPDTFWLLSFNVLSSIAVGISILSGFILGIVRATRQRKKGEAL